MFGLAEVTATTWLGQPALALSTRALRIVTVPGMGAKIVSLLNLRTGREWLLPSAARAFVPPGYGASFVDADMSGWDEIFPTTNACVYPSGAYAGTQLPDHGEVWSLPWDVEDGPEASIQLASTGRALPYRLTRTLRALSDHTVRMEYVVVNCGEAPFAALWAAHPQFAVDGRTRIVLPPSVLDVVNVYPTETWPDVGAVIAWPNAQAASGETLALDRIGPAERHRCRKFFAPPDKPLHWAALYQDEAGDWVRLSWDLHAVPYLGIWVDEGVYNAVPTAALEPTTGYFDDLSLACRTERALWLVPDVPYRWYVDVTLGSGPLSEATR